MLYKKLIFLTLIASVISHALWCAENVVKQRRILFNNRVNANIPIWIYQPVKGRQVDEISGYYVNPRSTNGITLRKNNDRWINTIKIGQWKNPQKINEEPFLEDLPTIVIQKINAYLIANEKAPSSNYLEVRILNLDPQDQNRIQLIKHKE